MVDLDESIEGWIPTEDSAFVVNEPQGSPGWYPANDTPKDKATYDFAISVPRGREALANGKLVANFDRGSRSIWIWRARDPLTPYLATATSGEFETRFGELPGGLPEYDAVDPMTQRFAPPDAPEPGLAWARLAAQPGAIALFEGSTVTTRSRRSARSSTGPRTSSTRSSHRRSRTTGRCPRSRPSSTRCSPVVRKLGQAHRVAGHLAERGLRDLVDVDLLRAHRRADRSGRVRRALRDPADRRGGLPGPLVSRPAQSERSRGAFPHAGLRPRRDDASGSSGEGGR